MGTAIRIVSVSEGRQPAEKGSESPSVIGLSFAANLSMRRIFQALPIAALLLAWAPAAHAQLSFDVRIGTPPPAPRAYRVPPQPSPDYVWIEGYWYPEDGQYRWHNGYWSRPPYPDAYWVAPYYQSGQYYTGHWEGSRGDVHHDHRWDEDRQRDERWGSAEASPRGRSMTREEAQAIVRSAYRNVLGRDPDPASGGWFDRVYNDHWSQQQLENELRNSAEYREKHRRGR